MDCDTGLQSELLSRRTCHEHALPEAFEHLFVLSCLREKGPLSHQPLYAAWPPHLRKSNFNFSLLILSRQNIFYFIYLLILCACYLCGHALVEDREQLVGVDLSVYHLSPGGPVGVTYREFLNLQSCLGGSVAFSRQTISYWFPIEEMCYDSIFSNSLPLSDPFLSLLAG